MIDYDGNAVCDVCYATTGDRYEVCTVCDPDERQAALRLLERTPKRWKRWSVPGRLLVTGEPIYNGDYVAVAVMRNRPSANVLRDLGDNWPADLPYKRVSYKRVLLELHRLRFNVDSVAWCYAADDGEIDDLLRSIDRAPVRR